MCLIPFCITIPLCRRDTRGKPRRLALPLSPASFLASPTAPSLPSPAALSLLGGYSRSRVLTASFLHHWTQRYGHFWVTDSKMTRARAVNTRTPQPTPPRPSFRALKESRVPHTHQSLTAKSRRESPDQPPLLPEEAVAVPS